MRIFHLGIGNLGPGGVSTYVGQVTAGQRRRGDDVMVAELWPEAESPSPAETTLSDLDSLPGLLREYRPDVLHLHSQLPTYEHISVPAVLTTHEHSAHCPAGGRYLHRLRMECPKPYEPLSCLAGHFLFKCGSRNPQSIAHRFKVTRNVLQFEGRWIAPSSYSRDRLLQRGLPPESVHLVLNPGPAAGAPDHPSRPVGEEFLFVGRLLSYKGCDVAIHAVSLNPDLRLRVLGDGPTRSELETLALRLGVGDRVQFDGWRPHTEVVDLMRSSLALLVPSIWPEPFGLVALEAFSSRRPVISARSGGLVDIVDSGRNGLLVAPGSPTDLCAAMTAIRGDRDLADRMGSEGSRDVVEKFSLERHLDALENVYRKAMAGRPVASNEILVP